MNNGERVGDEWLYGRRAHELIESELVTKDMVESYRYDLFLEEQNTIGEDAALTRDRDRRSSHDKYYSDVVYSLAAE